MAYSITTLKADLTGLLHGTTTNKITNLDGLINRAARDVLMDCDPQETKRITPITNAVYNSVWDYPCPTDLKGNRIIDLFPQQNRTVTDVPVQIYNQAFDISKTTSLLNNFTIVWDSGVKYLRINAPSAQAPVTINACDSLTENGTWTAVNGGTNISLDTRGQYEGDGAIQFDVGVSGGAVTNSTMDQIDLSDYTDSSAIFLMLYIPDSTLLTSSELRWGSSSANYWSATATGPVVGSWQTGWNLVKYEWAGASVTGTPDESAVDFILLAVSTTTSDTEYKIDNIFFSLGEIYELEYYSKYIFRSATTGTFQETVTADSNLVNLDTESYDLLLYKTAALLAQQTQGSDALQYDGSFFEQKYKDILERYSQMYKSEVVKPKTTYYSMPTPRRTGPTVRRSY